MKVVFSTEAKAALREIALFIASDNKARALSFVRELRAKGQQLGDMPRGFPLVPRYEHHGIRRRPFGDYLIFYRVEAEQVAIVLIHHGARDYEPCSFRKTDGCLVVIVRRCLSSRAGVEREGSLRAGL